MLGMANCWPRFASGCYSHQLGLANHPKIPRTRIDRFPGFFLQNRGRMLVFVESGRGYRPVRGDSAISIRVLSHD